MEFMAIRCIWYSASSFHMISFSIIVIIRIISSLIIIIIIVVIITYCSSSRVCLSSPFPSGSACTNSWMVSVSSRCVFLLVPSSARVWAPCCPGALFHSMHEASSCPRLRSCPPIIWTVRLRSCPLLILRLVLRCPLRWCVRVFAVLLFFRLWRFWARPYKLRGLVIQFVFQLFLPRQLQ